MSENPLEEFGGLRERQKTLGEMLTLLRSRLGFVSQGPASKLNEEILKSFLDDAVAYVWDNSNHAEYKRIARIPTVKGEVLYDFHDDELDRNIDPTYVQHISVSDGSNRFPLQGGISEALRANQETGRPNYWDMMDGQLEVYPVPDGGKYSLVIEYTDNGYTFDRLTDRCPVPWRIAFLFALAYAKAHYSQRDAQSVGAAADDALKRYRGRQVNGLHYHAPEPQCGMWYVTRGTDGVDRGGFR